MMMHHGIVSHFNWQDKVMKEYLVEHWRKQAKQIAKMGIKVCFTGHFHAQDVSEKYGLTDMETGSTVSYPQVSPQDSSQTLEALFLEVGFHHEEDWQVS